MPSGDKRTALGDYPEFLRPNQGGLEEMTHWTQRKKNSRVMAGENEDNITLLLKWGLEVHRDPERKHWNGWVTFLKLTCNIVLSDLQLFCPRMSRNRFIPNRDIILYSLLSPHVSCAAAPGENDGHLCPCILQSQNGLLLRLWGHCDKQMS